MVDNIIWKIIPDINNYEVSNTGLVRNKKTLKLIKIKINKKYIKVVLLNKSYTLYNLVAQNHIKQFDIRTNFINYIDNNI